MNILQRENTKSLKMLLTICKNNKHTVDANFTVYNDNTYCLNVWYINQGMSQVQSYEALPDDLVLHITSAYTAEYWNNEAEGLKGCYYNMKGNQIFTLKEKIDSILFQYFQNKRR